MPQAPAAFACAVPQAIRPNGLLGSTFAAADPIPDFPSLYIAGNNRQPAEYLSWGNWTMFCAWRRLHVRHAGHPFMVRVDRAGRCFNIAPGSLHSMRHVFSTQPKCPRPGCPHWTEGGARLLVAGNSRIKTGPGSVVLALRRLVSKRVQWAVAPMDCPDPIIQLVGALAIASQGGVDGKHH